jgi:uncharacterized membrane protein
MITLPLHPAVIHFPIAIVTALPLVAIGAMWAIRRGRPPRMAWVVPVAVSLLLAATVFAAVQTGEADEEIAAPIVSDAVIEHHEESAERFAVLVYGTVILMGFGLLRSPAGGVARAAATVATVGLLGAAILVGHSGGELVYRFGAGAAHEMPASQVAPELPANR